MRNSRRISIVLILALGGALLVCCGKRSAESHEAMNGRRLEPPQVVEVENSERAFREPPPKPSEIEEAVAEVTEALERTNAPVEGNDRSEGVLRDTKGVEYSKAYLADQLAKQRESERLLSEQAPLDLAFSTLPEIRKTNWFEAQSDFIQENIRSSKFYWGADKSSFLFRLGVVDENGKFVPIPEFPAVEVDQTGRRQYPLFLP